MVSDRMGITRDILITLLLLAVGVAIIAGFVGIALFAFKAIGVLLLLAGIFLVVFFPGVPDYQPEPMAKLGIKIGFVFLLAGLVILFLL